MFEKLAERIEKSDNIVAFTGAGVSTESGIPDFRSSGGVYDSLRRKYGYAPEYMLSHDFFIEHTDIFYDYYRNSLIPSGAAPNRCHKGLAFLEETDRLKAVVTQNIDGLQQQAGSRKVLELHGTIHKNKCIKCGKGFSLDRVLRDAAAVPRCDACGGIIKPEVVLYQEQLDSEVLGEAVSYISKADVLMVIGTSLAVYPAAGLLDYFRGSGLVLINKSSTPYDAKADIVIQDYAGKVMGALMERLKERGRGDA